MKHIVGPAYYLIKVNSKKRLISHHEKIPQLLNE